MNDFNRYDIVKTDGKTNFKGLLEIVRPAEDKDSYWVTRTEEDSEFVIYGGRLILVCSAENRVDVYKLISKKLKEMTL